MKVWWVCETHDSQARTGAHDHCWAFAYIPFADIEPCRMVEMQLVPADALVVERVEGKWPEWALLGLRSGLFKGPPASQEHVGKRWGYMLDALASAQDGGEPPKDPWDYDP